MNRASIGLLGLLGIALTGCGLDKSQLTRADEAVPLPSYAALEIETPSVESPDALDNYMTPSPITIDEDSPPEYWDLKLQEVVQIAMQNSKVLRDLGVGVIRAPSSTRTIHDPAIVETDPRFGVDAALSAFDATFATSAFFEKNDRALNNTFFGGGTRLLQQDAAVFQSQLSKRAVTGTEFSLRHNTDYDANNAPGNQFPSAWNMNIEALVRHPLMQGGGVTFNRIAGPSTVPGVANGVLVARTNTDVSLAEFEIGVRNLVNDVENVYWDLYFAYRDLDARVTARNTALETWRRINALYTTGRRGGEAEKEAQAREQYFRFQEEVQNALTGRLVEGTRTQNGSGGGTFRATGGVHVNERRLRLLMGIPINDGRLIRPAEEPVKAKVIFDWDVALVEALERRVELRRQKWQVKRREMELTASHNYLLPRLDAVGRYRWRGFGKDLLGYDSEAEFNNATENLFNGNFQEWQLGFEFSYPLGNRRGAAAVRNAELLLARERVLLREQEREVILDVSNAMAEMDRAYAAMHTNFNRRVAAKQQLEAVEAAFEADNAPLDLVLEAQRRLADAESQYYRAVVEYSLAVKNVHFEKGSLLDLNDVYLEEGHWPVKAYHDAELRNMLRSKPIDRNYKLITEPGVISEGPTPQQSLAMPRQMLESPELPLGVPLEPGVEVPEPQPPAAIEAPPALPPTPPIGDASADSRPTASGRSVSQAATARPESATAVNSAEARSNPVRPALAEDDGDEESLDLGFE